MQNKNTNNQDDPENSIYTQSMIDDLLREELYSFSNDDKYYQLISSYPEKMYYSMSEAATAIGLTYAALQKGVFSGKIRSVQIGKNKAIPVDEVSRLLVEDI